MPTRTNQLRAQIFTTFDEAEARWRHYETLEDHYVYQTFDWARRWFETIGRHQRITPCLVDVADDAGTPLAFLPMAIERRSFGAALIWLGGGITDYSGPLLTADGAERLNGTTLGDIWTALRKRHPAIAYADFQRQPASIGELANPFFPLGRAARTELAMSTCLSGDWQSYYAAKRGKKTRETDRRKHRRLEKLGALAFVIATDPREADAQITAMLAQKKRYVARLGQLNVLEEPGHHDFLKRMAIDPAVRANTLLCALKLDETILAVRWGVLHRRRFYNIVASYDDGDFARYSTGDILLREFFAWCFENDVEIADFTCGEEAYKRAWCERTLRLEDRLLPLSPLGHTMVTAKLLLAGLRHRARAFGALRNAVGAIRGLTRQGLMRHRPAEAAAGRPASPGRS